MQIWKTPDLETGNSWYWKIGNRAFWIQKIENGWKIAGKLEEDFAWEPVINQTQEKPEDLPWSTVYSGKKKQIKMLPQLPDKPLLLKPDQEYILFPKQTLKIFITAPVWIQIKTFSSSDEKVLKEFPCCELSNTWFGEVDSGELAYSSDSPIYENFSKIPYLYHRIICPLKIRNTADIPLDLIRLSLNVPHLNVYQSGDSLIADMITVEYKGQDQVSRVSYSKDKTIDADMKLLAEAREIHKRSIFRTSFSFIRSIYQT